MDEMDDYGLHWRSNRTWKPNVRYTEYVQTCTTTAHEIEIDDNVVGNVIQYLMTQYGLNAGLRKSGKNKEEATSKELT